MVGLQIFGKPWFPLCTVPFVGMSADWEIRVEMRSHRKGNMQENVSVGWNVVWRLMFQDQVLQIYLTINKLNASNLSYYIKLSLIHI